jgi:hypothetical protein
MYKVIGLGLLALGVVLLVMGFNSADSIGSHFSRFFTGNPTDKSIWLILGGVVSILLGGGGLIASRGQPSRA